MASVKQVQWRPEVDIIEDDSELATSSTVMVVTAHTKPIPHDPDVTVESYLAALLQHSCREQYLEEELIASYRHTEKLYTQLAEMRVRIAETGLLLFKIPVAIADGETKGEITKRVGAAWEALKSACV